MRLPPLTLVLGGVASGKSAFARRMADRSGLPRTCIETVENHDEDMAAEALARRGRLVAQGWRMIEAPHDLAGALARADDGAAVLVDSIGDWLTNILVDAGDWEEELDLLIDRLLETRGPVVLVSGDVSGALVPGHDLAHAFQRAQGAVNQSLAAEADLVVQVTAGLPQVLKGMPDPGGPGEAGGRGDAGAVPGAGQDGGPR